MTDQVKRSNVSKPTLTALFNYLIEHPELNVICVAHDGSNWRALTWEYEEV